MTLDSTLLAILACPEDELPLYYIDVRVECSTTPAWKRTLRSA